MGVDVDNTKGNSDCERVGGNLLMVDGLIAGRLRHFLVAKRMLFQAVASL